VTGRPLGRSRHLRRASLEAWAIPTLLASVAIAGALIGTRRGPALSPDSVTYLSAARNLVAGHGYRDFTGQADTTFPPGLAAMLAAGKQVGLSFSASARVLNALAFSSIVLLAWALLRRHGTSTPVRVVTTGFVALSPALLDDARHLWSEPLFCALVLSYIIAIERALAERDGWAFRVATTGTLAGAAFLLRYAALALIIAGVVTLAWSARARPRNALARVATFVAAAALLPGIWVLRNATADASYVLGPRVSDPAGPDALTRRFLASLQSLFLPTSGRSVFVVIAIPVLLLGLIGAYATLRHRRSGGAVYTASLVPAGTFVAVYAGLVVVSGKLSGSSIDARIVSPLYVPILIAGAVLLDRGVHYLRARTESPRVVAGARWTLVTALLGLGAFTATWFTSAAIRGGTVEQGYGSISRRSPLAVAVRSLPPRAVITTNQPWALYFATGRQPITPLPARLYPSASLTPPTPDRLTDLACSRPVYLAWHGLTPRATPALLANHLDLVPTETVRDGAVYAVGSSSDHCEVARLATRRRPQHDVHDSDS
jgi:hypothetical protein